VSIHWKSLAKAGKSGDVEIKKYTISIQESKEILETTGDPIEPGIYTKLIIAGEVVMVDTPREMREHVPLFDNCSGHVLITGLGLGCCLNYILNWGRQLASVIVLEKNQDVINLVAPYFPDIPIINESAFTWNPNGYYFDCVWHDIWPDIGKHNLPEMKQLENLFAPYCGWQGFWAKDQC